MGGGGGGTSTTVPQIPPQFDPLVQRSVQNLISTQSMAPVWSFLTPNVQQTASTAPLYQSFFNAIPQTQQSTLGMQQYNNFLPSALGQGFYIQQAGAPSQTLQQLASRLQLPPGVGSRNPYL